MGLLDEIAQAAAARRATDTNEREAREASERRIAEQQYKSLTRWDRELVPSIEVAIDKLNDALGGQATGDFLKPHSLSNAQLIRGHVVQGEQMSLTLNYVRSQRPNHFIKFALEAKYGPDPVVLVISHDQRSVVRLVVDDDFKKGLIEHYLARIVRDIECTAS